MLDYVLEHESGIYYVYEYRLDKVPDEFQSKAASRYLGAVELIAQYRTGKEKLAFVCKWLKNNQRANGTWDFGEKAKDGVYFPLSDRWDASNRVVDSTHRVCRLLEKLTG